MHPNLEGQTDLKFEGIEAAGHRVLALAPSAEASRGVLREAGFADAETVARFLVDERLQQEARDGVLLIDEASLLGTRTLARVFDLARHGCVLVAGRDEYGLNRVKTHNAWGEPFTPVPEPPGPGAPGLDNGSDLRRSGR